MLLHGCCHNPTGADLSRGQWRELLGVFSRRDLLPYIDLAYLGLGAGVDADAFGVRLFAEHLPEALIAVSCSKNFGLYRERTGTLHVIGESSVVAQAALSQLLRIARTTYSMPPDHGAAIVHEVLANASLRSAWLTGFDAMRARISGLRRDPSPAWRGPAPDGISSFIEAQQGMFSYLGLSAEQVRALREQHHVYMTDDSRINIAGLRSENLDYFAACVAQVLRGSARDVYDETVPPQSGPALVTMSMLPRVQAAFADRSPLAFYLLAGFAMWVFALGPDPTLLDQRVLYRSPYGQLMRLPGFDGLRGPARFWMMSLVCLSTIAALAVNKIGGRYRTIVVTVAALGLLLDGWPRGFPVVPAPELRPSPSGVAARLDLPLNSDTDARALYQQMFDPIPLYNGFSGYFAPHYYALRTLLDAGDPRILQVLAANGTLGVVIDHAGDEDGAFRRFVLSYPGAQVVHDGRTWSSYRLPRSSSAPQIPDRSGSLLHVKTLSTFPSPPHAARALDGDLSTRWSGGVQQVFAEVVIELEEMSHVGQIEIDLGGFTTDFPKRLQIDVSVDGRAWETAWIGDTALHAYYGALRHPREMPLVFALNRSGVRFIRLRQTGFGKNDWSIPELYVRQ